MINRQPLAKLCFGSTNEREILPITGANMSPLMRRIVHKVTVDIAHNPKRCSIVTQREKKVGKMWQHINSYKALCTKKSIRSTDRLWSNQMAMVHLYRKCPVFNMQWEMDHVSTIPTSIQFQCNSVCGRSVSREVCHHVIFE